MHEYSRTVEFILWEKGGYSRRGPQRIESFDSINAAWRYLEEKHLSEVYTVADNDEIEERVVWKREY